MHALIAASAALASVQQQPACQALTLADVTPEIAPPVPLSARWGNRLSAQAGDTTAPYGISSLIGVSKSGSQGGGVTWAEVGEDLLLVSTRNSCLTQQASAAERKRSSTSSRTTPMR